MTTTYTITPTSLYTLPEVEGKANVVIYAEYIVSGTDGVHTAYADVNQEYTLDQNSAFTSYADLTKDQVISWIPSNDLESAKARVDDRIALMVNPPVTPSSQPLPWVTV
jgi:hypothetical protein